ncbi:AAA family ATPase [Anaerovibrio slackiae]|uniref:AAA family ATPase n=1 Tax=Anaerovibrio slackiae TaxID=2652309 RepID=UPI0038667809
MARAIAVGEQDFVKIRENDYFYIDKTGFITDWWRGADNTTAVMRPRRFGKTLNISMMRAFFSVEYQGRGAELFGGLKVWQDEAMRRLQGTYPVIFISFAVVKADNYADTMQWIKRIFAEIVAKFDFLLDSDRVSDYNRQALRRILEEMDNVTAAGVINLLCLCLRQYYGKKVIILLDEYDTPMHEAFAGGYWAELSGFMRQFFNATFKTNENLERALMTGITRVAKESIFSDLNHLVVVTVQSDDYADAFGFTEQEVFAAMDECGLADKAFVKQWYDGFTIGSHHDIYNPWSIINYLDRKGRLECYWANSSGNGLVSQLLQSGSAELKKQFEVLLQGNSLEAEIEDQVVFADLNDSISSVWSLFLASGYLTGEKIKLLEEGHFLCRLRITNRETRIMFERLVSRWFRRRGEEYYNEFIRYMLQGNVQAMNDYMNRIALYTFSSFDAGRHPSEETEPERFYHGFVLGLMVDLKDRYVITSNRESGYGRYDVMLEPRHADVDAAIILEFKVFDKYGEKSLEETVRSALQQIEDKQYAASLEAKGIDANRIRKYGFAFEGKNVLIGSC